MVLSCKGLVTVGTRTFGSGIGSARRERCSVWFEKAVS